MKNLIITIAALFATQLATAQLTIGGGATYTSFENSTGLGGYATLEYKGFGLQFNATQDDLPSLGGKSYTNQLLGASFTYNYGLGEIDLTAFAGVNQHSTFSGNEIDGMASLDVDFESIETKKMKPQFGVKVGYRFIELGYDPINKTAFGGLRIRFGNGDFTKSGAHKYKGTRHSSKKD